MGPPSDDDTDFDATIPPKKMLRHEPPAELYRAIPEVAYFTRQTPDEGEESHRFFERLKASTTPEDAVTFTAFATEPGVAIRWGMDCIRVAVPEPAPDEMQLLSWVATWLDHPNHDNRWRAMQVAMFAPRRSPAVYLGLAVGWSGGPLAPNDPVQVPAWRCPRAVNSAIMRSIGQVGLERRSACLARVLDLAAGLFRVY